MGLSVLSAVTRGLIRGSIIENVLAMDCRVKPGNDEV
jgi:hypothetical protein